ncbi:hypothetical protein F5887DRAFT_914353 [Amanita rubescens]|nr:hypothetical protein F5887DRAFT_914353 [Amanita rubescens]
MSNFTSATSDDLGLHSITFGNGLIPVGALTTLIGSDIAETLALGERGSAGLVWSVASLHQRGESRVAQITAGVAGVSLPIERIGLDLNLAAQIQLGNQRSTVNPFRGTTPHGLQKTLPRDPLTVYNCITTGLMAHVTLALISAIHFAFFFVSGCIIAFREIFLARRPANIGNLDAIIGELPTWKKAGGEKNVVLGLLADPRTSIWWGIMWFIGGLLHIVSLVLTYFILSKMTPAFTLAWAGFQATWLACRILAYYFTESIEPMADRMMVGHQWQDLDMLMKTRVLSLTLAAAQYQTHVHPRGIESYADDSFSARHIMNLISEPRELRMSCELPRDFDLSKSSSIEIKITATIGDTVLSSAMWMVGPDTSPMDMYDCCLVFLSFPPSPSPSSRSLGPPPAPSTFAIPAARVAYDIGESNRPDTEKSAPVFVPRGISTGYVQAWLYWIPCGPNRWLQVQSKNMTVLGRCTAEVLDDGQLSALLGAGNLNISLKHANEVRETVERSRVGVEALFKLLPGTK